MASLYEMANEWTVRELKKEYTRLRDQFQKQIGRLAKQYTGPRVQAFMKGGYKFQRTIKEIENLRGRQTWSEKAIREDWARRVSELKGLTEARSLSLSGLKAIRKDTINALRERGFTSINERNFGKFSTFMAFAKAQGALQEYDSNNIVQAFDIWASSGVLEDEKLGGLIDVWQATVQSIDLFD